MPARGDRVRLTAEQERIVREMLAAGATACAAALQAGITYQRLKWALYETGQLADVRVGQGRRGSVRPAVQAGDPSVEEIEAAMARIRERNGHAPDFSARSREGR